MTRSPQPDKSRRIPVALPEAPLAAPASFLEAAASHGLGFDVGDLEQLGNYLAILLRANETANLTAIRDPEEAWTRHVFDALTLLPVVGELSSAGSDRVELLDIGSGGGIPGIPLAIALPGVNVTLLDATEKKTRFLEDAAQVLGLENVGVIRARAERAGADAMLRGSFDGVTARAVGHLAIIAELAAPLLRVNGLLIATKGEKADQELAESAPALEALLLSHAGTVATPTGRVVVLQKDAPTPRRFPRADGEPRRNPLWSPLE